MRRQLPPLNALKTFEAAARLRSFSLAADELCVTQGAVSKQIKLLEHWLATPLFERRGGRIELTAQAEHYLPAVSEALNALNTATTRLFPRQQPTETLRIDCLPSLTAGWLIARLPEFEQLHPGLSVNMITGEGKPDFAASEADLAIRCLPTHTPQPHARLLLPERMVLIASPLQAEAIHSPADLLRFKLLQQTTRPGLWERCLGPLELHPQPQHYGAGFQHFFMLIEGVRQNLGIGLVPDFLVADAAQQKLITTPLQLSFSSDFGYFLFLADSKHPPKKLSIFSNWLTTRIQQSSESWQSTTKDGCTIAVP